MLSFTVGLARPIVSVRRLLLNRPRRLAVGFLVAGSAVASGQGMAQQVTPVATPERNDAPRTILETAARNFESCAKTEKDAGKRGDCVRQAQMIRKRLATGDFQAGHRILLFVAGDSALSDTFTVRSDQKLQLPNLPEISLAGVLDSELQAYLQKQLAQYIRNPAVRAQALLRVSVAGDVANPGFYPVRTDTPVSDVIMLAGGPSQAADINKAELRRGSSVVVNRDGIQTAIRKELTMSDIGARPGDELFIPAKPQGTRWQKFAAVVGSVTGIVWAVVYIAGRR